MCNARVFLPPPQSILFYLKQPIFHATVPPLERVLESWKEGDAAQAREKCKFVQRVRERAFAIYRGNYRELSGIVEERPFACNGRELTICCLPSTSGSRYASCCEPLARLRLERRNWQASLAVLHGREKCRLRGELERFNPSTLLFEENGSKEEGLNVGVERVEKCLFGEKEKLSKRSNCNWKI